jgi:hypothetical protein
MSMNFWFPLGNIGSTPAGCPILLPLGILPPAAAAVVRQPVGALFNFAFSKAAA